MAPTVTWGSLTVTWNSATTDWTGTLVAGQPFNVGAADSAVAFDSAATTTAGSPSVAERTTTSDLGSVTTDAIQPPATASPILDTPIDPARRPPRTGYRFYACDLATGQRWNSLPLVPQGEVVRSMMAVETLEFEIPVFDDQQLTVAWETVTQPGRTMIVCERQSDRRIMQGWVILQRTQSSTGVSIHCATLEAFLDRRFVRNHGVNPDWYSVDSATVVFAGLLADAQTDGNGTANGVNFLTDFRTSGNTARQYLASDSQTVLAALVEITEAENGPEAVIDIDWLPGSQRSYVRKTIRAYPRLGVRDVDGRCRFFAGPSGSVTSYSDVWDYTSEHGAIEVEAASADLAVISTAHTDAALIASGWPTWQAHVDHANVGSLSQLEGYAAKDLARMRLGNHAWAFTSFGAVTPRPLADFDIGDDVRLEISPWAVHPRGYSLTARCSSWRLDVATEQVTPVLVEGEWPAETPPAPDIIIIVTDTTGNTSVPASDTATATDNASSGNRTVSASDTATATDVGAQSTTGSTAKSGTDTAAAADTASQTSSLYPATNLYPSTTLYPKP